MNCAKIAEKIAKEVCVVAHLISAFNFKKSIALTKKELDNPGKNFDVRKQDSKGLPVSVYIQYPKDGSNFWYLFWITDRMQYAEIEIFHSEQQAKKFMDNLLEKYQRMKERKEQRKKEKAEEKANFKHSFKVGDIIVCSWGYEQTNVDFYLVKEVGEKSVKIVEVGTKVVKHTDNGDDLVVPYPQKETGKLMTKIVKPGDRVKIYSFADGHKWNGKPVYETNPYNYR